MPMKKVITIALTVMLLTAAVPSSAFADREQDVQVEYTVTQDMLTTPTPSPTATANPSTTPSAKPTTSPKPAVPKTGDKSNLPLLAVVCCGSLLVGLGTYAYLRRKKDGEADD